MYVHWGKLPSNKCMGKGVLNSIANSGYRLNYHRLLNNSVSISRNRMRCLTKIFMSFIRTENINFLHRYISIFSGMSRLKNSSGYRNLIHF